MLVLTRSVGEKFTVETPDGSTLEITLIETRGKLARIGFEGPKETFNILRSELHPRKGTEADGKNTP